MEINNVFQRVLGMDKPEFFIARKIERNPDLFRMDESKDYKEDFEKTESGNYVQTLEPNYFDSYEDEPYTITISKEEWEKLPNKPKPTEYQKKLAIEVVKCRIKEREAGIIHSNSLQENCTKTPVPKLVFNSGESSD